VERGSIPRRCSNGGRLATATLTSPEHQSPHGRRFDTSALRQLFRARYYRITSIGLQRTHTRHCDAPIAEPPKRRVHEAALPTGPVPKHKRYHPSDDNHRPRHAAGSADPDGAPLLTPEVSV